MLTFSHGKRRLYSLTFLKTANRDKPIYYIMKFYLIFLFLYIESEINYVPIFNYIFLALKPVQSRFFTLSFTS